VDKLYIQGGKPLQGTLSIEGAKNALLPLMAATLLTDQPVTLRRATPFSDTFMMIQLLTELGGCIDFNQADRVLHISIPRVQKATAPYDVVRKMRASILILGPLLARYGQASISLPGGCAIGVRPVDFHIKALEALGAKITLKNGILDARAPNGLQGSTYAFPQVSVTGTANLLMAATLAQGETEIFNAAREPEIVDLTHCLIKMGAQIEGVGTAHLKIKGVSSLKGVTYTVIPDRIEMGTYIMACGITGGELCFKGGNLGLLSTVIHLLKEVGIQFQEMGEGLKVSSPPPQELSARDMITEPYPGFPTDLQAQFMALMTLVPDSSLIRETIFENRFMHAAELTRMGANITIDGHTACVRGINMLKGAPLMATDLRASVSLVLAGLAATGETTINRIYHLDRGYFDLEEKLHACGARISRAP
jgi:UDP-N-acetylglucosamine 1-carboxyvinyltransferase